MQHRLLINRQMMLLSMICLCFGYNLSYFFVNIARFDLNKDTIYILATAVACLIFGIETFGKLSEKSGRKILLVSGFAILMVAALNLSLAEELWWLWLALDMAAIAVGMLVAGLMVYTVEIAPGYYRGSCVIWLFMMAEFGFGLAIFAKYLIPQLNQLMIANLSATALAMTALLLSCILIESPGWLFEQLREPEAMQLLTKLRAPANSEKECQVIKSGIRRRKTAWYELYKKQLKHKIKVAIRLTIITQLSGCAVFIFSVPHWLPVQGMEQVILAAVICLALLVGLFLAQLNVDFLGRRPLILLSIIGQSCALLILSICLAWPQIVSDAVLLAAIAYVLYLVSFAAGAGPLNWLVWTELMPLKKRSAYASTLLSVTVLLGVLIVAAVDWLAPRVGVAPVINLFAVLSMLSFVWLWKTLPETKNRLIDEI